MRTPAGVCRLVGFSAKASLLACVLPVAAFPAETTRTIRAAGATPLPRYDPAIREKYLADQAASTSAPKSSPPATTPAPAKPSADDRLVLDTVVVHPDAAARPPPLPRVGSFAPRRDLPGEPFESGSAREARLVRKHLGEFGQALSRVPLLGKLFVAGALQAEAELKRAQQFDHLADDIELAVLTGQDPEITRKARAEYLRLYYSGPPK